MIQSNSHILICRTDNIGDVVLTLPLAGYLKKLYPNVKIDFLCRSYAAPVVKNCCFVDEVIALETLTNPVAYFAASAIDIIIFAYPNRRLAKAAKIAKIANRVGTSHRISHWFTCNKLAHFSRVKSRQHEAQLNFKLLRPLGLDVAPNLAEIPLLYGLDARENTEVRALFSAHGFNLIFHPKSNGNGREWPIAHYAELADLLSSNTDIKIWITGSAAEGQWITENFPALLQAPNVSSLCGQFDLDGLSSLIKFADGLIASGTGSLHMSAALGQRTLGLFPPVKPIHPGRWAPLGLRAQVLCQTQECAQCQDPLFCTCMRKIEPESVAKIVNTWVDNKKAVAHKAHELTN